MQKHTLSCNRVKLACTNDSPSKNTQSKNFFIPYSEKLILLKWGVVPSSSFFSTLRPAREKQFRPSATSALVLPFHQNHPSSTSPREMGKESREHSFQLIYQSDGIWFNHQLHLSYIAKTLKWAVKHLLQHAYRLSSGSLSHYKGTRWWERAILDDTCQQIPVIKTYHRYSEKSPERLEKYQNIMSYHLKNLEKLWVNVSFQSPIVLGVQYQGVGNFKTI